MQTLKSISVQIEYIISAAAPPTPPLTLPLSLLLSLPTALIVCLALPLEKLKQSKGPKRQPQCRAPRATAVTGVTGSSLKG